jgi:hypothetical protein
MHTPKRGIIMLFSHHHFICLDSDLCFLGNFLSVSKEERNSFAFLYVHDAALSCSSPMVLFLGP